MYRDARSTKQKNTRLSLVSHVCCQTEFSASGWSPVQSCLTGCCISECDREASTKWERWHFATYGKYTNQNCIRE